jgi:hypothetical protein
METNLSRKSYYLCCFIPCLKKKSLSRSESSFLGSGGIGTFLVKEGRDETIALIADGLGPAVSLFSISRFCFDLFAWLLPTCCSECSNSALAKAETPSGILQVYPVYSDFSEFNQDFTTLIWSIARQHSTVDLWVGVTPKSQTSALASWQYITRYYISKPNKIGTSEALEAAIYKNKIGSNASILQNWQEFI